MCIEIKTCEVPCFTCQLDSDLRITSNTQQRTAELHGTATPAVYVVCTMRVYIRTY